VKDNVERSGDGHRGEADHHEERQPPDPPHGRSSVVYH
jgi:hypothetical protein